MYKINLFLIALFTLLNTDFTAQEKVKLPTKNDMVYYRETYTGLDAAKCIASYIKVSGPNSVQLIEDSLIRVRYKNISSAKSPIKFRFNKRGAGSYINGSKHSKNCIDTLSYRVDVVYPYHSSIGNGIVLFETIKSIQQASGMKKELHNGFSFDVYIYIKDKNTIDIVAKNYKYVASTQEKNHIGREIISLEDNYKKYLENDKPKNHQHKFYEDVNFFTKRVFSLIYSDLKRAIQTTDL